MKKTILITGANGWIGSNAYYALKDDYNLVLIDNKTGKDQYNRFGIEHAEPFFQTPSEKIIQLDLVTARESFAELLRKHAPDCVLHLAGALENQTVETIGKNVVINNNVLEICAAQCVPVIAASSIMVMYGAAISNEKIANIIRTKHGLLQENEKLSVNEPFNNTVLTIKEFSENDWQPKLCYIHAKELLEILAAKLISQDNRLTIIVVRFGWTGVKNPYELEGANVRYTETSVYLDQADLQSFLIKLIAAVVTSKVTGFKRYICISAHPQTWVKLDEAKQDFDWLPIINVEEKFATQQKLLCNYPS